MIKNKRKKRSKQPYSEIVDLKFELKEYRKLCKGTSKKFTYYLEWKKHISDKLSKLDSLDKVENFKHYLINHSRINKSMYIQLVPIMIFCFTIIFGKIFQDADLISLFMGIMLILFFILFENDYYDKERCFYCDVLEILEEVYEKEKK